MNKGRPQCASHFFKHVRRSVLLKTVGGFVDVSKLFMSAEKPESSQACVFYALEKECFNQNCPFSHDNDVILRYLKQQLEYSKAAKKQEEKRNREVLRRVEEALGDDDDESESSSSVTSVDDNLMYVLSLQNCLRFNSLFYFGLG